MFQMKGEVMWSSLVPKVLHISPQWLVITDRQKKVARIYNSVLI